MGWHAWGTWGICSTQPSGASIRCCGALLPKTLSTIAGIHYIICIWSGFAENIIKILHPFNWCCSILLFEKLINLGKKKTKQHLPKNKLQFQTSLLGCLYNTALPNCSVGAICSWEELLQDLASVFVHTPFNKDLCSLLMGNPIVLRRMRMLHLKHNFMDGKPYLDLLCSAREFM